MRHIITALAILVATPAAAQLRQDEQVWVNLTAMGPILDRLVYFAEIQPRVADGVSRLDLTILRPAIGWKLSPAVTVYQGYARVESPGVDGAAGRGEDRLFQQISWTLPAGVRSELSSRTRLEERLRSDGRDMALRLRQMMRGEWAFSPDGRGVRALGSVEAMIALNDADWISQTGVDQVRTFVGVEIPVKGRSTIEAGYLNQAINQPGGAARMNHVASISLFFRH